MKYLRLLLLPFSLIYGLIILMRNWCYDACLLKSTQFDLPVISVGNLEIGGAGKSPMTEYLIRLLTGRYKLATLSRGYGRETKGYFEAEHASTATQIGDEPAQFKSKFPDVTVAVCEKRVIGIERLKQDHNVILLDDAYQHRAVRPSLSILLFDYQAITHTQWMLPAGNLREPMSGRWRADILVVTKCPDDIKDDNMKYVANKLSPLPYQTLFYSSIAYYPLQNFFDKQLTKELTLKMTVLLITGIANPYPLLKHLKNKVAQVIHHNYADHHRFSLKNITKLAEDFNELQTEKKIIVTTEKDAQRLGEHELINLLQSLPVFVLPIGIKILNNAQNFDQLILNDVTEHIQHR